MREYITERTRLLLELINQGDIQAYMQREKNLEYYEDICQFYDHIQEEFFFKNRLAKYFRGRFYESTGNIIKAESAYREALDTWAPPETNQILSDQFIKLNLLLLYFSQGNYSLAAPILEELLSFIPDGKPGYGLLKDDIYKIYTIRYCIYDIYGTGITNKDKTIIKRQLMEIHQNTIGKGSRMAYDVEVLAGFVFSSILLLSGDVDFPGRDYELYMDLAEQLKRESFSPQVKVLMGQAYLQLVKKDRKQMEEVVNYCVKLAEESGVSRLKVEIWQTATSFYCEAGKMDMGKQYLHKCLEEIMEIWLSSVCYINDQRLSCDLGDLQFQFSLCYFMMRMAYDIYFSYEKVLQFKKLASLAVKRRNTIMHKDWSGGKPGFQEVHDEMADREVKSIVQGSPVLYADNDKYLEKLRAEAEFYEKFPRNVQFADVTWEKFRTFVPDNSAVVEYFAYEDSWSDNSIPKGVYIDIYIVCKVGSRCILKRKVIMEGGIILRDAGTFIALFQEEAASCSGLGEEKKRLKEKLRRRLYHKLLEPVLIDIEGIRRVYIAPDRDLINIPFGILCGEDNVPLESRHDVIQMECGRDFLPGYARTKAFKGSLIIGDPQYKVPEQDVQAGTEVRGEEKNNETREILKRLPCSKIEAERVSVYCGCRYYSGREATKNLLLSAEGYRNIHIATHGNFDLKSKTEPIYSSFLVFAGAENWFQTGEKSRKYGNGVVTADEISRLDLRAVELAVITSCWSGMNSISETRGFQGLLGGFAAAGVRYVISNLWEANDFATAVLMDAFYFYYMNERQEPFLALKNAKNDVRKITVRQLRRKGWFKQMEHLLGREVSQEYNCSDDWRCPFEDEIYWGGFICYQCN